MSKIVIEEDHFLKIVRVILDPDATDAHRRAVVDFFAHDQPDFPTWCAHLRARIPGLFPARVVFVADEAEMRAELADADGLVVESFRVGEEALAGAGRLAVVQKFGTIASNIDAAACERRGIKVERLRRIGNVAVAEQAFALLLALAKRICALNGVVTEAALNAAGYRVRPRSPHIGYSNFAGITGLGTLHGATLGIVGLGEVGREVAQRAAAFGMKILYFQRSRIAAADEQAFGAQYVALADLMARSDYILVQLPLNAATRGIIGRDLLRRVRPGAVLVNVARAELIDRAAVIEALDSGRLAGFGLDVGYAEPTDPDDPLLRYRDGNVILMPHTAIGARANALADLEQLCVNLADAIAQRAGAPKPAASAPATSC
ncbi:MAG TPA: NAD(P)-dependent oxidoreductase [Xanthobacteraceae bacterium]|jgi:lactate dehydrogenase-like 2-hydroxyacid dehydrogenase|nr:NAD(P)-dependent oxidoreductase [Xanthobacteraceae bacterium]